MKHLAILLPFALSSCVPDGKSDNLCEVLPGKSTTITPTQSGTQYFPASFGKPSHVCNFKGYPECFPRISKIESEWYPKHWEAAGEPSLFEISKKSSARNNFTLRFTWLPTFDHPVIIRLEKKGREIRLIAKELSGAGGYEPGKVTRDIVRALTDNEVRQLSEILKSTSVIEQPATDCELGLDGSQWIVEMADESRYRFLNRWSPKTGPVRKFGVFVLGLTGWQYDTIY